jgi:hypothetical protein
MGLERLFWLGVASPHPVDRCVYNQRLLRSVHAEVIMDPGSVSAIISAVAGIRGVLFGNTFVLVKDWWAKRNKVNQDTTYLGIIVVSRLDRFAADLPVSALLHPLPSLGGRAH